MSHKIQARKERILSLLKFIKENPGLKQDQIIGIYGFKTGISPISIKNYLKVLVGAGVVVTRGFYENTQYYHKDYPKLNEGS